jgi:nicotinamidase-related amidase
VADPLTIAYGSTAMIVVELQNDLVHASLSGQRGLPGALARAVELGGVLEHVRSVLDACRAAKVPVVYATRERHPSVPLAPLPLYRRAPATSFLAPESWGAQIVDELAPQDGDTVLRRYRSLDPSYGAGLWRVLRRLEVDTVLVAGVSTTLAVEGTVRAAANRGLRSVVVADGCASVPEEWHRFSIENVLPLLADVVTSDRVVAALGGDGSTPDGG